MTGKILGKIKNLIQPAHNKPGELKWQNQAEIPENMTESSKYLNVTTVFEDLHNLDGCENHSSNNETVQRWWKQVMKLYKQL